MGMDGLVPTFSVNDGGNNANGWGDAIGAFAGARLVPRILSGHLRYIEPDEPGCAGQGL